ncbi:carboxylating nicotinate-nucleotide diphosphorylase [Herbiconiux sp. A18JL235]|uniref:Nicotinate-nucleotide pyrophosphorylase [carboxylating] n=1 Tax=Herbiconiux sp. A18JL235 TaxID=3152363 RepID=A0AB39BI66_9MICO
MLTPQIVDDVVARALAEDAPWGDITSELLIPVEARIDAVLSAREPGVLSGGPVIVAAMRAVDPRIRVELTRDDGARFVAGDTLATIEGPARGVLRAERVALNLAQRMSGIATLTARYVDAVAGTAARIVDTRKTTPGLRAIERAAVRAGGGFNHRFSLSDAVLAKDNHLAVLAAQHDGDLTAAIRSVRSRMSHTTHLEVEVDRVDQIEPVVAAGVDTILLDNFSLDELREGVAIVAGRALVDASGGVDLSTVADIAATGVDLISVGALTHSVRALDLGLDAVLRP